MKRKSTPRPEQKSRANFATARPWPATILAIDTAAVSGWARWVAGRLMDFGDCNMLGDLFATPRAICELANATDIPGVLIFERPFRGTTQGQWSGAWKMAWSEGGGHPRRIVGVYPSTWRAKVLAHGMHAATRDRVRKLEMQMAIAIVQRHGQDAVQKKTPSPDAAAAILIGYWGTASPSVGKVLPAKVRQLRSLQWKTTT